MLLARVLGRVVATVKQETLSSVTLQWIQPLTATGKETGRPIVAADPLGAGPGEVVVYITAREAALTLRNSFAAVDAGIVAKVDWCDVGGERTLEESED
jgi:microcompartment protein CcmK/EutM